MVEETEDGSTDKSALKPAQLAASALAAVTAAFLGSTLGVGGTVAGAGIASVVTTLGSEFYLRSMRRTRAAARKTAKVLAMTDTRLRQETTSVEPPPRRPANPLMQPVPPGQGRLPGRRLDQVHRTSGVPMAGHGASGLGERTVYLPRTGAQPQPPTQRVPPPTQGGPPGAQQPTRAIRHGADAPTRIVTPPDQRGEQPQAGKPQADKPWWKNRWTLIAASSVAAFIVGMLAITGFESITGHAVSGGQGTTFSQVVRGSSTGGGASTTKTTTEQPSTTTTTHGSTATPTESSARETQQSSASSTPTPRSAAPRSSVQQSEPAQPTESAAPTSG